MYVSIQCFKSIDFHFYLDLNSAGPFLDESTIGVKCLVAPPISVMLGQEMVETSVVKSEGVSTKKGHLEQSLFSIVCSADDSGLCLYPIGIDVKLENPSSFPERVSLTLLEFKFPKAFEVNSNDELDGRPSKRLKVTANGANSTDDDDIMYAVEILSQLLTATIGEHEDECVD
jgi:hypothetical protein